MVEVWQRKAGNGLVGFGKGFLGTTDAIQRRS